MLDKHDFGDKEPDPDRMRQFMGPHVIDHCIREAIQMCWMMLPPEKKTIDEVERQIRRIVDRAIRNMREDDSAMGKADET